MGVAKERQSDRGRERGGEQEEQDGVPGDRQPVGRSFM
jgi:hypothetical protein